MTKAEKQQTLNDLYRNLQAKTDELVQHSRPDQRAERQSIGREIEAIQANIAEVQAQPTTD